MYYERLDAKSSQAAIATGSGFLGGELPHTIGQEVGEALVLDNRDFEATFTFFSPVNGWIVYTKGGLASNDSQFPGIAHFDYTL